MQCLHFQFFTRKIMRMLRHRWKWAITMQSAHLIPFMIITTAIFLFTVTLWFNYKIRVRHPRFTIRIFPCTWHLLQNGMHIETESRMRSRWYKMTWFFVRFRRKSFLKCPFQHAPKQSILIYIILASWHQQIYTPCCRRRNNFRRFVVAH